jgi:hypothetical protein
MRKCKCGGEANVRLIYDKPSTRGIARYRSGWKCMRCADKEAFAVLTRGIDRVMAERRKEVA